MAAQGIPERVVRSPIPSVSTRSFAQPQSVLELQPSRAKTDVTRVETSTRQSTQPALTSTHGKPVQSSIAMLSVPNRSESRDVTNVQRNNDRSQDTKQTEITTQSRSQPKVVVQPSMPKNNGIPNPTQTQVISRPNVNGQSPSMSPLTPRWQPRPPSNTDSYLTVNDV